MSESSAAPGASVALPEEDVLTSTSQGAIEGVVVDDSLAPIGNATVSITGSTIIDNRTTVTSESGRFVFSLLDPGTYKLLATGVGYSTGLGFSLVSAGEATRVTISLSERPGKAAYSELRIHKAQLACSIAFVYASAGCGGSYTAAVWGSDTVNDWHQIPAGHKAITFETSWSQSSHSLGQQLVWSTHNIAFAANQTDTTFYYIGDGAGHPPLQKVLVSGQLASSYANKERYPVPESVDGFWLQAQTYFLGDMQTEINQTAPSAVCANAFLGYCSGVGATIQEVVTHYITVFYNAAPENLDLYTAIPDA